MAIKLLILLAMLAGLVSYAQSAPQSETVYPSLRGYQKMFAKAGYTQAAQSSIGRGSILDIFEMKIPTVPHYHRWIYVDVTSRDDSVLTVSHHESSVDEPD